MTDLGKLRAGDATAVEALDIFDGLKPVDTAFMIGAWRGEELPTGHPLDGFLAACRWHGKRFESEETAHPLVFSNRKSGLVCVDPKLVGALLPLVGRVPLPKPAVVCRLFRIVMPLLVTRRSRARLRMTEYRGKLSATMIYDQLPIHDVFRRLDADSVVGAMDLKGMSPPFFFLLRRERSDRPTS